MNALHRERAVGSPWRRLHRPNWQAWLLALVLALAAVPAQTAQPAAQPLAVPPLLASVTDLTATLTAEQQVNLETRLRAF